MHPDLFRLGPFTLHAYGTMLALSFLLGLLLARRRAKQRGLGEAMIMDLFQLIVLSAIVGSRFFFVIFHLDSFSGRWWHVFALWEGGLTLYGGLLLAMLASVLYVRAKRASFLRVADVMSPSLGLGLMITRLGCFLNGCCFGLPTASALGIRFPADCEASLTAARIAGEHGASGGLAVAIHPTQLYSSFGGLIILLALLALDRKARPDGSLFAGFLCLYGLDRLVIDEFRYYEEVMRAGGLSVNQWLSIGMIAAGVFLFARLRRSAQRAAA